MQSTINSTCIIRLSVFVVIYLQSTKPTDPVVSTTSATVKVITTASGRQYLQTSHGTTPLPLNQQQQHLESRSTRFHRFGGFKM